MYVIQISFVKSNDTANGEPSDETDREVDG